MKHSEKLPSREYLLKHFAYDPSAGVLSRVGGKPDKRFPAGSQCGSRNTRGYYQVRAPHKLYMAHRLIWVMMTGEDPGDLEIDHVNNVIDDNRWSNLRLADRSHNMFNASKARSNSSGSKGVFWRKDCSTWIGLIVADGVRYYLGRFEHKEDAITAVRKKRQELHKEFTNHG